jgi:hypothetical protein
MEGTTFSVLSGLAYFAHELLLVVTVAKVTKQTQHTIRLSLNNFPSNTHYLLPYLQVRLEYVLRLTLNILYP